MNSKVKPYIARTLRTVCQFIASGGLTALVTSLAGHFSPADSVLILGGFHVLVTFSQNYLEDKCIIPAFFKTVEKC